MRIEIVSDEAALASRAADVICDTVRRKPDAVLGLPTGATPIATYLELAKRAGDGGCDWRGATAFAIDEFTAAGRTTPGTNSSYYRKYLHMEMRALHIPNAAAAHGDEHIGAYAAAIRRAGGLDLCVLGIGINGHIAFNEPGSGRECRARAVDLTPESRSAHAAAFGSLDAVPPRGMTLGIADLLESRAILVLASGAHKAAIVARAIDGTEGADVPASWLQSHGNVAWLIDKEAASELTPR
jgi:glucosamine-6-phosphate deaminase